MHEPDRPTPGRLAPGRATATATGAVARALAVAAACATGVVAAVVLPPAAALAGGCVAGVHPLRVGIFYTAFALALVVGAKHYSSLHATVKLTGGRTHGSFSGSLLEGGSASGTFSCG